MSNHSREEDAAARRSRNIRYAIWSSSAVVVIVLFIILAKVAGGGSSSDTTSGSGIASPSLMSKITSLTDDDFKDIGQGSATTLPKAISAPVLQQNGLPQVLYIGAEYCPYCATERWPMVVALSRFGSFTNLGTTHSASADVYPNTQTFSFHGASYTSKYLSFVGVETESNVVSGTSYAKLDALTASEQTILSTYDAAPYVAANSAGAIPFIDFGGKYIVSGSTYSPTILQGKSADQIASALTDKSSDIYKGVMGAANTITAAICNLTGQQPSNVCSIQQTNGLAAKLNQ